MAKQSRKNLKNKQGRQAKSKSPLLLSNQKRGNAQGAKQPRATHAKLWLTRSRQIVITRRRFKSSKHNRSRSTKQIVLPLYVGRYKEIAIKLERKRLAKTYKFSPQSLLTAGFILLGLTGTLYFGWKALIGTEPPKLEPVAAYSLPAPIVKESEIKGLPRSEPTHIRVPDGGIDANITSIGRNVDNTIEVPPDPKIAGWYRHGPTPGEIGPAIIVGHVDSKNGPEVFWGLRELLPGQVVEINRADGKIVKFRVDSIKQFDQSNFPTQEVYGNLNYSGLRLITCAGTYNSQNNRYTHNTVVYASLIKENT